MAREEWRPVSIENWPLEVSSLKRLRNRRGEIIRHSGSIGLLDDGKITSWSVAKLAEMAFAREVRSIKLPRRRPRGRNNVKLTEAQVLEIRRQGAIDHSGAELRRLADLYGVSRSSIEDVIFCRNWKHLPGEPPPRLPRGRPKGT